MNGENKAKSTELSRNKALKMEVHNNLKEVRQRCNLSQPQASKKLYEVGCVLDTIMLSKIENGKVLPTPWQLYCLAQIYGVQSCELVSIDLHALELYAANTSLASHANGNVSE